jgi:hypothetical protein
MTEYESYLRSWTPPPAGIPDGALCGGALHSATTGRWRVSDGVLTNLPRARQLVSDAFDTWKIRQPITRIGGLSIEDEQ